MLDRQAEPEAAAGIALTIYSYGSTVLLDDGAADCQTQTDSSTGSAVALGYLLESLEDELSIARRNARALIGDRNLDDLCRFIIIIIIIIIIIRLGGGGDHFSVRLGIRHIATIIRFSDLAG